MKSSQLVLGTITVMLVLSSASLWIPIARAQQSPALAAPLPPASIRLTTTPARIPPGSSGVVIVQLVDANGNPSPARGEVAVNLFSSDPTVAGVSQDVTVAFGRSHAEAKMTAGIAGSAILTATADGFLSGSAKVSVSLFSDFSLQLVPLNDPVSPGGSLHLRVGLTASGRPFEAPDGVQASITTSLEGVPQQAADIHPGSSDAYVSISVPSGVSLQTTPYLTVTAAATGFTSAKAVIGLSPQGMNPEVVVVGPPRANLTASSDEFLSVSLLNGTFAPAAGSLTLDLFSSNSSVVRPLVSQVSTNGAESATFQAYAGAPGTAQITAIAPGQTPIPLSVRVVAPFKPVLGISLPARVRAGEQYSFSVGFYDGTGEPIHYGPAAVHLSSSDVNVTMPPEVEVSALGYAVGTFEARGTRLANITAVTEGATTATMTVASVFSPAVAPTTYTIRAQSDSGPLAGVPVNFTYDGRTSVTATRPSGTVAFDAYNDTATLVSVPSSITLANRTYFFTGWSNGGKYENVSLLASTPVNSITAQYFRSVVPTAYSLLALSDGREPVGGVQFNVSSRALGENFTFTTDSNGEVRFVLPNASSFTVSLPEVYQPSAQIRYSLISLGNSTKNIVNITSPAAMTIEARFATYYKFQVASPVGNTTGSGWYRSGSSASYSVDQLSSGGPLVFQRFGGWSGNFSSSQPGGSTVITSPESITAQWSTDNSLLFAAAGIAVATATVIGLLVFRLRKRMPPS